MHGSWSNCLRFMMYLSLNNIALTAKREGKRGAGSCSAYLSKTNIEDVNNIAALPKPKLSKLEKR